MTTASAKLDAGRSGAFRIGDLEINRLGFGAMRITGAGIWGEPDDRAEALRTLKRLPELGVNFIDTADSYGPDISEELIREALHPYGKIVVATKGGLTRTGPGQWTPVGRREYLIQQAHKSLRNLGVKQIDLWQLHRIDAKTPRQEQFETIRFLIDEGIIRYAGLSEVTVADIKEASKHFKVATVQNRYNLVDRQSEGVLDYCTEHGIGFIPWFPLAAGSLAKPGGPGRQHRGQAQGDCRADSARLDPEAQPRDAAHSRHFQGEAPRRKCRGGGHHPQQRGVRRARQRGTRRSHNGLGCTKRRHRAS
jgi:aryl-alcohol dehydrogenase-like predicted oxidoreductase